MVPQLTLDQIAQDDVNGIFKSIMAPNASDTIVTGINGYGYITGNARFASGRKAFTAHCQ